jgi:hypothetical protein
VFECDKMEEEMSRFSEILLDIDDKEVSFWVICFLLKQWWELIFWQVDTYLLLNTTRKPIFSVCGFFVIDSAFCFMVNIFNISLLFYRNWLW